jgi:hypothetical protein
MNEAGTARGIVSLALLAALAIPFFYISLLSPIVHDIWHYARASVGFESWSDPVMAYWGAYWRTNPRLGELAMRAAGASTPARTLVNFGSLVALVMTAFAIMTGHLFRPHRINHVMTVALFLSLLWLNDPIIGQVFFYTPYTTNYLLGYAILLAFLVPYRIALTRSSFPAERWLVYALPPFGILAGLTNEHTPPIYIAMIGVALTLYRMTAQRRTWMAAGVAGLTIGFVLLFFAPGQSIRYGGVKYQAMAFELDSKVAAVKLIAQHFAPDGWPLALLLVLVATSAVLWLGRDRWRENATEERSSLTLAALLAIAAVGMAVPLVVSPMMGARLLFASHVNLAMATTVVLLAVSTAPAWRALLGVAAIGINAAFLSKAYFAYRAYHRQFVERVEIIETQKAAGISPVVMPGYTIDFGKLAKYVHREKCDADPAVLINRAKAKYFRVPSLAMDCSWR